MTSNWKHTWSALTTVWKSSTEMTPAPASWADCVAVVCRTQSCPAATGYIWRSTPTRPYNARASTLRTPPVLSVYLSSNSITSVLVSSRSPSSLPPLLCTHGSPCSVFSSTLLLGLSSSERGVGLQGRPWVSWRVILHEGTVKAQHSTHPVNY